MVFKQAQLFIDSEPCTYVQFGQKDVGMVCSKEWQGKVFVKLANKGKTTASDYWNVILEFPNTESLDALIKVLEEAKTKLTESK